VLASVGGGAIKAATHRGLTARRLAAPRLASVVEEPTAAKDATSIVHRRSSVSHERSNTVLLGETPRFLLGEHVAAAADPSERIRAAAS
jgi:hypothetical protein